jgi:hypothetical protein
MNEAVEKLLDIAENAEKQVGNMPRPVLEWLNGVREALEKEYKTKLDLSPSEVLEIIAYALSINKNTKQHVNDLIVKAIKDTVKRHT